MLDPERMRQIISLIRDPIVANLTSLLLIASITASWGHIVEHLKLGHGCLGAFFSHTKL